jgi:hypothetical protein
MAKKTIAQVVVVVISGLNIAGPLILDAQAVFPNWPWQIHVLIGFIVFAGFMIWMVAEEKLKPKPHLQIFDIPIPDKRPIRDINDQRIIYGTPLFAHVEFHNKPKKRSEEANAKKVFAQITFYDMNGTKKLRPELVRFGGTPQPPHQNRGRPKHEYYEVEFNANGREHELTIAMKYENDNNCYGYSDMNYSYPQWKKPDYELIGKDFYVHINLSGENTEGNWWFLLHNYGKGQGLQLETITEPKFYKNIRRVLSPN